MPFIKVTLFDVADRVLPSFNPELSAYTSRVLEQRGINIRTGEAVTSVRSKTLSLKSGEDVPYGLMIWSTGLAPLPLVEKMDLPKDRMKRLTTDDRLRVLSHDGEVVPGVYAVGDCATIKGNDLACTAQVAKQKALYLSQTLNNPSTAAAPFEYRHKGSMAYVGGWKAVVEMESGVQRKGKLGWMIWRGAYLSMADSWRNRVKIPTYWVLTWLMGRELSRFN
jgi:NADH dehydrogenase FAD-containing subunit